MTDATPAVAALTEAQRTAIEAAAFRRLVEHLQEHPEVQNLDLMNLAGFCRNCLARWYRQAAGEQGTELTDTEARTVVYGMDPGEWKARFQRP